MNDSELRRKELLKQTRRLYNDRQEIPAVHPRYGNIYKNLYEKNSCDTGREGSFLFRLLFSILLFVCFIYIDRVNTGIDHLNSTVITEQIGRNDFHGLNFFTLYPD